MWVKLGTILMPKIYSTSFVSPPDLPEAYLGIPHSLCHDPTEAPYTPNIPRPQHN